MSPSIQVLEFIKKKGGSVRMSSLYDMLPGNIVDQAIQRLWCDDMIIVNNVTGLITIIR